MTTFFALSGVSITIFSSLSKNPLKMSMMLLVSSSFILISCSETGMDKWFAYTFFLLFMGGILMMFMILSSILPNEPMTKKKSKMMFMPSLFFLALSYSTQNKFSSLTTSIYSIKALILESGGFYLLMMLVSLYFFFTILNMKTESLPMRTSAC